MVDPDTTASILADALATGLPDSVYEKQGWADDQKLVNGGTETIGVLGFPSVYHKMQMMCYPVANENNPLERAAALDLGAPGNVALANHVFGAEQVSQCLTKDGKYVPGITVAGFVFDIGTSTSVQHCSGEPCRKAAQAMIDYQSFLGTVTSFKWDALRVITGATKTLPIYDSTAWTFQRSCPALRNIVDKVVEAQSKLPQLVTQMRAAAPQLNGVCIAPARDSITPGIASVIGKDRALKNRDTIETWGLGPLAEQCDCVMGSCLNVGVPAK